MAHYPQPHRWPLRWLPDLCACGAHRYDRCPDAVHNAAAGEYAPLGGRATGAVIAPRRWGDDPPTRRGRWP